MNIDIITALVDQAADKDKVPIHCDGLWTFSTDELERFVKLLIKDCAQLVSDWDSPHYVGTAGELIKSHFGIE